MTPTTRPIEYTQKLQHLLIDIGNAVEKMQEQPTLTIPEIEILYDKFLQAVDKDDTAAIGKALKELIAALAKWRVEKL